MAKTDANKGVSLELHAKEGLEQLKVRASSDTANIKAELRSVRKGVERADHERYEVANIQSQVDKCEQKWIEMWEKDMEGDINLVLSILDERMGKIEVGGVMMAGG